MWVLIVLLISSADVRYEHPTIRSVGAYPTREACEAAALDWWQADRSPPGMPDWRQITPGHCDPVPLVG